MAFGTARLERDIRHESACRGVEGFARGVAVGLRGLDGRIVGERDRKDAVFRGRQSREASRSAQIVRLDADHLAEFGACILEAAAEFGQRDFGGVDAFTRLLEIALPGATAAETLLDVSENALVRRDVFLRERDEAGVADDVDVSFGGVERDQLGALMRARSGSVDARRVAPDLVQ